MIIKIIYLFLLIVALLAMMGRLKLPGGRRISLNKPKKCPRCGNIVFDKIECRCHLSSKDPEA